MDEVDRKDRLGGDVLGQNGEIVPADTTRPSVVPSSLHHVQPLR